MTTPATFLSVFCGTLAVVAVVRFVRADERDAVETGTMLVVVGIALAADGWAAGDHVSFALLVAGLAAGAVAVLAGTAVVARSWPERSEAASDDGGSSRGL